MQNTSKGNIIDKSLCNAVKNQTFHSNSGNKLNQHYQTAFFESPAAPRMMWILCSSHLTGHKRIDSVVYCEALCFMSCGRVENVCYFFPQWKALLYRVFVHLWIKHLPGNLKFQTAPLACQRLLRSASPLDRSNVETPNLCLVST